MKNSTGSSLRSSDNHGLSALLHVDTTSYRHSLPCVGYLVGLKSWGISSHHKVRYTTTLPATPWPQGPGSISLQSGGLEEAQGDQDRCP
jgi:hypothetical protein